MKKQHATLTHVGRGDAANDASERDKKLCGRFELIERIFRLDLEACKVAVSKNNQLLRLLSSPFFATAPRFETLSIKAGTADELVSASPAMNQRQLTPPQLDLSRRADEPPMRINMEAFFHFSFWIAEELEDLVAIHSCSQRTNYGYDIPLPGDIAI